MRHLIMVLAVTCFTQSLPVTASGNDLFVDLPIKNIDYSANLVGPQKIIPGEFVEWRYPFAWAGTTKAGDRLPLVKGDLVRFLGLSSANTINMETAEGVQVATRVPPNVPSYHAVFQLSPIALRDTVGTATREVIANRIGNPQSIEQFDEYTIYHYSSGIITEQWVEHEKQISEERYYDYNYGGYRTRTFTTRTPVTRSRSFVAYDFEIHFDNDGRLLRHRDTSGALGVAERNIELKTPPK